MADRPAHTIGDRVCTCVCAQLTCRTRVFLRCKIRAGQAIKLWQRMSKSRTLEYPSGWWSSKKARARSQQVQTSATTTIHRPRPGSCARLSKASRSKSLHEVSATCRKWNRIPSTAPRLQQTMRHSLRLLALDFVALVLVCCASSVHTVMQVLGTRVRPLVFC